MTKLHFWTQGLTSAKAREKFLMSLKTYLRSRPKSWWLTRIIGVVVTYALLGYIVGSVQRAPSSFSAYLAKIKHTPALQTARLFLGGYDSYISAKNYYKSQEKHILASIKDTELHPYWAKSQEGLTDKETWQDMVMGRMKSVASQLKEGSRDDFKVEKDKCEMYGFLKRNDIPFVPLLGMWDNQDELVKFLSELKSKDKDYVFPLWLKSCHLTQGDDAGRIMIKHEDLTDSERFGKVVDWINRKYSQKPNDDARAWSDDARVVLDILKPRFIIQQSYPGPYGDSVGFPKKAPVELKVEVIWGRAYLANICDYEAYALRDGTIERWDTSLLSKIAHVPVTDKEHNQEALWLREEGHLEKVYALAERVCRAMKTDQVRVDIFVRPHDPDGVVVNEISISPGALYKWHAAFMAQMWRKGHVDHIYKLSVTTKKVYEEGPRRGQLGNGPDWFIAAPPGPVPPPGPAPVPPPPSPLAPPPAPRN